MEQGQPRVNPSDWASRRKHAMNRARELRSRIKEVEHNQGPSDVSSLASKSEIQRQRRSRQLEATQKLLDGQVGGFSLTESSSGRSGGSIGRSLDEEGRGRNGAIRQSAPSYNHDEQPVGGSGAQTRNDGSETHSIISQQHLGRIHKRYRKPSDNDPSAPKLDSNARSTEYSSKEGDIRISKDPTSVGGTCKSRSSSSDAVPGHTIHTTLRGKPLEGRGRGRGRRKSPLGSSSLGELSRPSKSISNVSTTVEDQMVDSRSRSPSTAQINNPSSPHMSHSSQANMDASEAMSRQSYLRSRQVPDFKEGECEKLAILRKRLVVRRRKHQVMNGKENAEPASPGSIAKSSGSKSQHGNGRHAGMGVKSGLKDNPRSLERLDPNDFSAKDFQTKPKKVNDGYRNVIGSLRGMETHEPDGCHSHSHETNSMDKSHISYPPHGRDDDGNDDEASVVEIKLLQCDSCKRSFAPKVYEKHFDSDGQPKCAGNLDKKRPVFNAAKARIANNSNLNSDEQMKILQVNKKVTKELSRKLQGKGSKKRSKKSDKWREESNNFREAMRANRLISKAEKEGKPAHYYL